MTISLEAQFVDNLHELRVLPEFFKNNEPQMNTDERRFNDRVSSFIRALNPVFAPSASWYERLSSSSMDRVHSRLCGEIKICTAKSAKNAKEGAINGCS